MCPSAFSSSSGAPLPVAEYAATAKIAKHGAAASSTHCYFVPLIVERFGARGTSYDFSRISVELLFPAFVCMIVVWLCS